MGFWGGGGQEKQGIVKEGNRKKPKDLVLLMELLKLHIGFQCYKSWLVCSLYWVLFLSFIVVLCWFVIGVKEGNRKKPKDLVLLMELLKLHIGFQCYKSWLVFSLYWVLFLSFIVVLCWFVIWWGGGGLGDLIWYVVKGDIFYIPWEVMILFFEVMDCFSLLYGTLCYYDIMTKAGTTWYY